MQILRKCSTCRLCFKRVCLHVHTVSIRIVGNYLTIINMLVVCETPEVIQMFPDSTLVFHMTVLL